MLSLFESALYIAFAPDQHNKLIFWLLECSSEDIEGWGVAGVWFQLKSLYSWFSGRDV